MPLVSAAACANDLGASHAVAGVADVLQVIGRKWRGEAGPAGAALELLATVEQRQAAQAAGVDSFPLLIEENAAKGSLGAMFEEDVALLLGEIGLEVAALL